MSLTPAICDATGKRRYTTKARAFRVAKWTAASNRRHRKTEAERIPVHAYRCDLCDGYHVGHKGWERDQVNKGRR